MSNWELAWRKTTGCLRQFGALETLKRMVKEIRRLSGKARDVLDISQTSGRVLIGAAPRSEQQTRELIGLGVTAIIDLRAERKEHDVLSTLNKQITKYHAPIYDDWQPIPVMFFSNLERRIKLAFEKDGTKLLLCCGAGEHRAPLAGVLALICLGESLESAVASVTKARPVAELLPVYMKSLEAYLAANAIDAPKNAIGP